MTCKWLITMVIASPLSRSIGHPTLARSTSSNVSGMVLRVSRGGHENLEITTTARGRRDDALGFGGMDLFREKQPTSSNNQQTNTKQ